MQGDLFRLVCFPFAERAVDPKGGVLLDESIGLGVHECVEGLCGKTEAVGKKRVVKGLSVGVLLFRVVRGCRVGDINAAGIDVAEVGIHLIGLILIRTEGSGTAGHEENSDESRKDCRQPFQPSVRVSSHFFSPFEDSLRLRKAFSNVWRFS